MPVVPSVLPAQPYDQRQRMPTAHPKRCGEQLWTQHTINLWLAGLNLALPFFVSSYSAARN